ncbi:aldehyde dehydrogenase [Marinobacterium lutimaris]|uniref:Gamma-glutamyl-gamma-aminobutyraldehyde dehydrogenase n=1 Tax=Marinobacterium lutimaris TaxID=568106 RepID=A0A1H5VEL7_9GAMM|nr:aldehyde dehydrogenase [Marinobacterium lutimaris]SEF85231.1 gamma-glutamyl-gamma-aminobutyraldehyde dehydrogenase [Marinobacterium lutimaris]
MSSLLKYEEYKAIASDLKLPSLSFVDGEFRPSVSGETFQSINPATGQVLANIASCNADDVDFAVAKAREAFDDGRWSKMHPGERKAVLLQLCKLVEENQHELAVMESLDSGKPIHDCETIDIPEFIHTLSWHAELIDKIYDQTAPVGSGAISMVVREPIGVVGAVLPWNFPLLMLAWKIAPALAAGCSMVIKPAAQTTLTALRIAELAVEAGLPKGVLNIVTGSGAGVGEPLGLHMDVDMVTFTGSTVTGRRFLRYSADSNIKKIVLELGGKNPCVVLDDAEDLDSVAEQVCAAAFWNMGENCSAGSRLIVQSGVKDELMERIKVHAKAWTLGDPLDPSNLLGAMIDKGHFEKVASYLEVGKEEGYELVLGGETIDGTYIQPTIFDGVSNTDRMAREEIFGPVLSVITVSSYEEAIAVANDTEYGLAASVFTANGKKALRAAQAIKAGTVTVNCFGEGDITTPFGGYKQSGFGGRDNSVHAHDQYTELKTIWVDLSTD